MKKPVVFLSHCAKNKGEMAALKKFLDEKTGGLINFFLSSDGESIPLGTNWVERLNKALRSADLMFVFVSGESLQSPWLLFESGYAYAQDKDVVPYCMRGTTLDDLPAPLKLLQGHTLHSASDLSTLICKCNEIFQLKVPTKITTAEYNRVFGRRAPRPQTRPVLAWHGLVKDVELKMIGPEGGAAALVRICRRAKHDCYIESSSPSGCRRQVHGAGISMTEESEWFDDLTRERVKGGEGRQYTFTVSPEMVDVAFPLIDKWRTQLKSRAFLSIEVDFDCAVHLERQGHALTTKLFESEIQIFDKTFYGFRDMRFSLYGRGPMRDGPPVLSFTCFKKLTRAPLADLITELWQKEVIWAEKSLEKEILARQRKEAARKLPAAARSI